MKHLTPAELIEIEHRRLRLFNWAAAELAAIEEARRDGSPGDQTRATLELAVCEDLKAVISALTWTMVPAAPLQPQSQFGRLSKGEAPSLPVEVQAQSNRPKRLKKH